MGSCGDANYRFRVTQNCSSVYVPGHTCEPIMVVAGQTTMAQIGPPYTPQLTVKTNGNVANLGLVVRGIGHETINCLVSGYTPSRNCFEQPFIPYADNSDTFSNVWKLRVIRLLRGFRWTVLT